MNIRQQVLLECLKATREHIEKSMLLVGVVQDNVVERPCELTRLGWSLEEALEAVNWLLGGIKK